MTGETERSPSGWTPDTLKVLEDEKINALERTVTIEVRRLEENTGALREIVALIAANAQLAQDKFEATVERDSVKQNEFRGSLEDLGKTMATRRELEASTRALSDRIDDLAKQVADLRSRLDIGPAGLATLATQQAVQTGRREGIQAVTANGLIALAALAGVIGALLGHFLK